MSLRLHTCHDHSKEKNLKKRKSPLPQKGGGSGDRGYPEAEPRGLPFELATLKAHSEQGVLIVSSREIHETLPKMPHCEIPRPPTIRIWFVAAERGGVAHRIPSCVSTRGGP